MYDFSKDIIRTLELILLQLSNSISKVNKNSNKDDVKIESLNIAKMIYGKNGELNLLYKYIKDFETLNKIESHYLYIESNSIKLLEKYNLQNEIIGAWSKYREKYDFFYDEIYFDILEEIEIEFKPLQQKFNLIVKFFSDYKDFENYQKKFNSIIEDAFSFIDLIMYLEKEVDNSSISFKKMQDKILNEDFEFNTSAKQIFNSKEGFMLFNYLVDYYLENPNKGRACEFSDIFAFLEKDFLKKRVGSKFRKYVQSTYNLKRYSRIDYRDPSKYKDSLKSIKNKFEIFMRLI